MPLRCTSWLHSQPLSRRPSWNSPVTASSSAPRSPPGTSTARTIRTAKQRHRRSWSRAHRPRRDAPDGRARLPTVAPIRAVRDRGRASLGVGQAPHRALHDVEPGRHRRPGHRHRHPGVGRHRVAVSDRQRDRLFFDPTSVSLTGYFVGQLALGVLGVLTVSAEYGTGSIRSTFAAIPRRPLVLLAKVLVFGAVALVVAEVVSFAAFFIGQALLSGSAPTASLAQPGVVRAVAGGGLYLTVLGLLALGLAAIIRHTAAAITTFVGVLLIVPLVVSAFPASIGHPIGKYLPLVMGEAMTATTPRGAHADFLPSFAPWTGFALLCAYAAGALVIGGIAMVRRDP